jgi:hypothetical protein
LEKLQEKLQKTQNLFIWIHKIHVLVHWNPLAIEEKDPQKRFVLLTIENGFSTKKLLF